MSLPPEPGPSASSDAKYRRLHEARLDAFVSVDLDGRITEFNDLFQEMVGYGAGELQQLHYRDLTPAKWHDFEQRIVEQQILARGHSDVYEKEYRRKDGTIFPVELRAILRRDAATGAPAGMWAIVRDISARREAEQALVESREALGVAQQSLLALINSTSDYIFSVDPHAFGLLVFNETFRRYFAARGLDARPGMTPAEMLPEAWAEKWRAMYRRALRDGPFVEQYVSSTGSPVMLLSFSLVHGSQGVSAIAVFGKDITARILMEEALRGSETRFREIAEAVSDFVWEVDADGLYTYTNPAVENILGYASAELIGLKHFYDLFAADVAEEHRRLAFEVQQRLESFRHVPSKFVRKDGRIVYVEVSGRPMFDANGGCTGYRGAITDVTGRRLTERVFRDLSGRLIHAQEEERSRLARELHDGVSQQLSLIAIGLDVLAQAPPTTADAQRDAYRALKAQVDVLAQDVHRMSHALHPARLEQLGLAGALHGLCHDLAGAHSIAIAFDPEDAPFLASPDVSLCLYRVAQEALQNVIKHSDAIEARLELRRVGDDAVLRVCDEGCGFDVDRAVRGDSIGMADMRERVRQIGGRLVITSAPGEGTCVEVHAPLAQPRAR